MDSFEIQQIRRLLSEIPLSEVLKAVKQEILDGLQSTTSPESAFELKRELDAVDHLELRLKRYAESVPVEVQLEREVRRRT